MVNVETKDGWFVWNKRKGPPTHRHESREGAETEARRLALANPGQKFIVLTMVSKFSAPVTPR